MRSTKSDFKRLIFILIDGAPYEVFKALIENGDLPNIKKHVVDQGSLNKAVSVFPSTTGPAFLPFFMGLYPGTANIPGIQWLSKSNFYYPHRFKRPGICNYMGIDALHFEDDLPEGFPTLFDFYPSVSNIYNRVTRGCPPSKNLTRQIKLFVYAYAYFFNRWRFIDQIAGHHLYKAVEQGKSLWHAFFLQLMPFHTI